MMSSADLSDLHTTNSGRRPSTICVPPNRNIVAPSGAAAGRRRAAATASAPAAELSGRTRRRAGW